MVSGCEKLQENLVGPVQGVKGIEPLLTRFENRGCGCLTQEAEQLEWF